MFLLLPHLQTWQVREPQFQFVLLLEILDHTAVVGVSRLHRQGKPGRSEVRGLGIVYRDRYCRETNRLIGRHNYIIYRQTI